VAGVSTATVNADPKGGHGRDRRREDDAPGRDTGGLLAVGATVAGTLAAMVGVSAGAVPEPGFDRPVWYGLVALVVGYWAAFVRMCRGRGRGRGRE
jgi:hypothetical protein